MKRVYYNTLRNVYTMIIKHNTIYYVVRPRAAFETRHSSKCVAACVRACQRGCMCSTSCNTCGHACWTVCDSLTARPSKTRVTLRSLVVYLLHIRNRILHPAPLPALSPIPRRHVPPGIKRAAYDGRPPVHRKKFLLPTPMFIL